MRKAVFPAFLFTVLVTNIFLLTYPVQASDVSGVINTDTIWRKANSPYSLTGNILVNHCSLTIEPGTVVDLNGYYIEVNGTLTARGTHDNPVYFNNGYEIEEGIIFDQTSNSWNENSGTGSIIENAVLDSVAIFGNSASPRINGNLFYNSGKYQNSTVAIFIILGSSKPPVVISNNTFCSTNSLATIYISSEDTNTQTPNIINNNFLTKNKYNINLWYYTPDVNAANNWWGTTDLQSINQTVKDYKNNFQFGKVNLLPILSAPNPDAPSLNQILEPSPTQTQPTSPNPTQAPPSNNTPALELFCVSSTTYLNFKVEITGNLTYLCTAVMGAPILLSYSVNNGNSWIDLTTVNTDSNGRFLASWTPQVSGNYLVKAVYEGDNEYYSVSSIVNFLVYPFEQRDVFSVTSNSTITALYFNSTNNQLSFSTNGTSGTTGQAIVTIPKTRAVEASKIQVCLDNSSLTYAVNDKEGAWIISFIFHQSSHDVTISLNTASATANTNSQWVTIGGVVSWAVIIIALMFIIWKKYRFNKSNKPEDYVSTL